MPPAKRESTVLTIRVDSSLKRSLAREARRQSLLVSGRESERDALELIEHAADTRGWE